MTVATRVWVYPERTFEDFGAVRYSLTWEEVRASAKGKEEIDHDEDIISKFQSFPAKATAIKKGRELVDGYKTAYGQATVTKQEVGWYVEEDRIAEWQDTNEVEYID